jgi:hypothetical protein
MAPHTFFGALMAFITIDNEQIKKFERDLTTFASKAYPFATQNTVNKSAFTGQKIARGLVPFMMTKRAAFTTTGIIVHRSVGQLDVKKQEARLGSAAFWMAHQEFGNVAETREKHGYPIPTTVASGEPEGAPTRRKKIRSHHLLKRVKLFKSQLKIKYQAKTKAKQQENLVRVKMAVKRKRRYVFLETDRVKGIFKIGNDKKPKLLYNLSHDSVRNPAVHWLDETITKVRPLIPGIYLDSLEFQMVRHGLFVKN